MPKRTSEVAEPVDLRDNRGVPKSSRAKPTLPAPPGFNITPQRIFGDWLATFKPEEMAKAVLHFYREYPAIDRRLADPNAKPKLIKLFDNSEDSTWEHSKDWAEYILQNREWGGSGKYKVMVTELGIPGCISMSKFKLEDSEYPPRVDPRVLIMGHPDNQGYIEGLRAEGKRLPGDDPEADRIEREEEEEMTVATEVVGVLKDELSHQREVANEAQRKVDEAHEKLREVRHAQGPSAESVAQGQVTGLAVEGAKAVIGMVTDQAREISRASAPSFNPVELFKVGMEARGGDNGMAIVQLVLGQQRDTMATIEKMHHETIEFLSKRDEEDDTPAPTNGTVAVQEDRRSLMSEIKDMTEFAEIMGFKRAGSENPPAPAGGGWLDKIGAAIAGNPMIVIAGLALVTNLLSKSPQSATDVLARAGVPPGTLPPIPGVPAAATPGPPQPSPTEQLNKFLEFLRPHFLNHFSSPDLDGYTLAADIHSINETPAGLQVVAGGPSTIRGRQEYQNMKGAGIEQFDQIIRNFPPIWNSISTSSHGPDMGSYTKFLKEFFDYDRWALQQVQPKVTTMRPI